MTNFRIKTLIIGLFITTLLATHVYADPPSVFYYQHIYNHSNKLLAISAGNTETFDFEDCSNPICLLKPNQVVLVRYMQADEVIMSEGGLFFQDFKKHKYEIDYNLCKRNFFSIDHQGPIVANQPILNDITIY